VPETEIRLRANLKALRIRPAREPGDKPVLEVVLRSEVDPRSFYLAAKAGKDLSVVFIPDPELQYPLPLDDDPDPDPDPDDEAEPERVTTVEPDGIVASTELVDHERRNAETVDRLEHQVAAAPDTNGVNHEAPGWQEQTGIGSSEIEQHRRRRRAKAEV
jgi:hypothetical protein